MAYGRVRGTGKVTAGGKGAIITELGLSTDGAGAPAKDDYYIVGVTPESGVTGHVCVKAEKTPFFLGPLWLHVSIFEKWDAAT